MIFNFFFKKEIVITNSPGQFRKLSLISPKTSDNFQKVVNYFRNLSIISEIAHIAKEFCKFLSNFSVFSFFSLCIHLRQEICKILGLRRRFFCLCHSHSFFDISLETMSRGGQKNNHFDLRRDRQSRQSQLKLSLLTTFPVQKRLKMSQN